MSAKVTSADRETAWLYLHKRPPTEGDFTARNWLDTGADSGPPDFRDEQILACGIALGRASVVDTELVGAERASLLQDLRMLMQHINGGPGTSRKPMRLGDGSELSRLEAFIRAASKGKP